jgi:hypothetical protein
VDRLAEAALTEEIRPPVPHSVRNFLALIDGHSVGTASSVYLGGSVGLIGGSTLREARAWGCYRALVHARWQDATANGYHSLVTQAVDATSKPILKCLGFTRLRPDGRRLSERPRIPERGPVDEVSLWWAVLLAPVQTRLGRSGCTRRSRAGSTSARMVLADSGTGALLRGRRHLLSPRSAPVGRGR